MRNGTITGWPATEDKDATMKYSTKKALALALCGLLALNGASAEDAAATKADDFEVIDTDAINRDLARKAVEAAAEEAVKAMRSENRLDLDIHLIGPTSVKIAGDR